MGTDGAADGNDANEHASAITWFQTSALARGDRLHHR
jgi:hypothetical protein